MITITSTCRRLLIVVMVSSVLVSGCGGIPARGESEVAEVDWNAIGRAAVNKVTPGCLRDTAQHTISGYADPVKEQWDIAATLWSGTPEGAYAYCLKVDGRDNALACSDWAHKFRVDQFNFQSCVKERAEAVYQAKVQSYEQYTQGLAAIEAQRNAWRAAVWGNYLNSRRAGRVNCTTNTIGSTQYLNCY